ncbi:MAG: DUF4886 domain-containing protein [Opitutales bacterium]
MRRILTIGNSFANNATCYIHELQRHADRTPIRLAKANLGGCSLQKHWNLLEQCRQLPDLRPYDAMVNAEVLGPRTLEDLLVEEPWDYVTLQQASVLSWEESTYQPWGDKLARRVRELAPQAAVVVHQTWAYQVDAPELRAFGLDQAGMFERLKAAYDAFAERLGAPVIPTGDAFQRARAQLNYRRDPDFDFEHPVPPQLPDQTGSLHAGYFWDTGNTASGRAELLLDGRHCNALGCYLGNAVWWECFTGQPAAENPFCPPEIDADTRAILTVAAHAAVAEAGGPLVDDAAVSEDQ